MEQAWERRWRRRSRCEVIAKIVGDGHDGRRDSGMDFYNDLLVEKLCRQQRAVQDAIHRGMMAPQPLELRVLAVSDSDLQIT